MSVGKKVFEVNSNREAKKQRFAEKSENVISITEKLSYARQVVRTV